MTGEGKLTLLILRVGKVIKNKSATIERACPILFFDLSLSSSPCLNCVPSQSCGNCYVFQTYASLLAITHFSF